MLYVMTTAAISMITTTCMILRLVCSFIFFMSNTPESLYCGKWIQIHTALNYINFWQIVKKGQHIFTENLFCAEVTAVQNIYADFSCFLRSMIFQITCNKQVASTRLGSFKEFCPCTCAPAALFNHCIK